MDTILVFFAKEANWEALWILTAGLLILVTLVEVVKTIVRRVTERVLDRQRVHTSQRRRNREIAETTDTEQMAVLLEEKDERREIVKFAAGLVGVIFLVVVVAPIVVVQLSMTIGANILGLLYLILGGVMLADQVTGMMFSRGQRKQTNRGLKTVARGLVLILAVSMVAMSVFFVDLYKAGKDEFISGLQEMGTKEQNLAGGDSER